MARTTQVGKERIPLSRDRVLRAALGLADEIGTGSLTMRKLAETLGVEAMSLYNHVPSKDAVLDGIVELVLDEVVLPADEEDWDGAIRRCAVSAHEALMRHPWACNVVIWPATADLSHGVDP